MSNAKLGRRELLVAGTAALAGGAAHAGGGDDRGAQVAPGGPAAGHAGPRPGSFILGLNTSTLREHKLSIAYRDQTDTPTKRVIWPIGLAFYDSKHAIVAWCELRQDFRFFRADRIAELSSTGERYPKRRAGLAKAFQEQMEAKKAREGS